MESVVVVIPGVLLAFSLIAILMGFCVVGTHPKSFTLSTSGAPNVGFVVDNFVDLGDRMWGCDHPLWMLVS